jgi:hypothetical protein
MKRQAILIFSIVSLASTAFAAPGPAPSVVMHEGLVPVQSRNLDKVYVRPNADLTGYNKVLIDPVQVEFSPNWWRSVNDPRYVARIRPEDARRIADETTANVGGIVAETRSRHVATKSRLRRVPRVLRVTPRVTELYVNAPDVFPPGVTRIVCPRGGKRRWFSKRATRERNPAG